MLVLLTISSLSLFAQTKSTNPWKFVPETVMAEKSQARQILPSKYLTATLDVAMMKSRLAEAPLWQTQAAETKEVIISLPMPDGKVERFRIMEAPVMHPDLQAQYPTIRCYAGVGIDDPYAYFRGDFTLKGFHGMIRSPEHSTVYIDPYSTSDVVNYQVYYRKDFSKSDPWACHFDEINHEHKPAPIDPAKMVGDCQLRTYSLALACTGEYAAFHGGTVAAVVSAFNTSMARVNGVFEQDASVHMNLVPNNNSLIFLNASTDPYSNTNGTAMLSQNQTTCDNVIGSANYDIGHVFSTGGGGVAYLGAVCNSSNPNNKAGGVTGQPNPIGDPFDIDYVAHEMGHQYGANHTQNNGCNRNDATAMEPGSASTIMGYAGICTPNVQNNSDDYFHAISLQEIAAQVGSNTGGGGNTCSTNSSFNNPPTANAGADYVIPKSTPFKLTGTGTDPNNDPITYTWEQMDNAVATMPPVATSTAGPMFRSFKDTTLSYRYLPRLIDVANNVNPTWEVLNSVGRTLNFRLTVRDNRVGGGCTAEDNMVVTVNGTAGPFVVTAPNTAISWPANSTQTVTWNVAGTTAAPVSCANVDILLSTDSGLTYPHTLATATPNDGTQTITLPNVVSTTARIMVKGNGNIFYDISNANFSITTATNGFTVNVTPGSQSVCSPANATYTVAVGVTGSFSGSVTLSASGLPAGATASFSPNPVVVPPAGNSTMTITTTGVAAGTYNFTVTGTSGAQSQSATASLTVLAGTPGTVTLVQPANGAVGISQTPLFSWNNATNATAYDLEVATDAGFTNIVISATNIPVNSYTPTTPLASNTLFYWHVRGTSQCGTGAYSTTFSFTTANNTCLTQASTDVPKTISASGTPIVTSILTISASGTITDVNLLNLGITHTWINDMIVKLKSPAGTEITLVSRICASEDNVLTNFDDAGSPYSSLPCPPTNNGTYQPLQALSAFNGQNINGTWTLTVQDMANQDGGSLNSWSLNLCYTPGNPPVAVVVTGTNVLCNGGNSGTATATASGGNGSYTYLWSNGGNTATITGLVAGTYTCTVTSGSASTSGSVTITQPAVLAANVTGTNPSSGNNGTATSTPTGGTAPYNYIWSNGGLTQTIMGLGAGTYTCTVTSTGGCTATGSVTLTGGGCNTQTINSQNFETGWGIWTDGGTDCARINNAAYANSGTFSIQLRDNTSTSLMSTTTQNLLSYNQITVNFSYITVNFANGEDFWLQISTNGGSTYTTVKTWVAGTNFNNNVRGTGTHTITGPFTSTTRIRLRCDASDDSDNVYIDDVVITGCLNFTGDPETDDRSISEENNLSTASETSLLAYPNPTTGKLNVEFTQTESAAKLVVTDMFGRTIQQQEVESNGTGLQQVSLDMSSLQPGTYLLQVLDGKERRYLQFVKI
jgi:subtilisin-like proprotein convertase family protein